MNFGFVFSNKLIYRNFLIDLLTANLLGEILKLIAIFSLHLKTMSSTDKN
jgi:hypothetical protein